jgi:hypothetical protein
MKQLPRLSKSTDNGRFGIDAARKYQLVNGGLEKQKGVRYGQIHLGAVTRR